MAEPVQVVDQPFGDSLGHPPVDPPGHPPIAALLDDLGDLPAVSHDVAAQGFDHGVEEILMQVVLPQHFQQRRSEEHTSELQSLMRISYAVFCLKKKKNKHEQYTK